MLKDHLFVVLVQFSQIYTRWPIAFYFLHLTQKVNFLVSFQNCLSRVVTPTRSCFTPPYQITHRHSSPGPSFEKTPTNRLPIRNHNHHKDHHNSSNEQICPQAICSFLETMQSFRALELSGTWGHGCLTVFNFRVLKGTAYAGSNRVKRVWKLFSLF